MNSTLIDELIKEISEKDYLAAGVMSVIELLIGKGIINSEEFEDQFRKSILFLKDDSDLN